tara:strand:- start:4564 stop:4818 length:255 start_codon:yes stop_codon:yes gene_type:complete
MMDCKKGSEFLDVLIGDYVAIKDTRLTSLSSKSSEDYWFAKIIDRIGGARSPNSWTLFQVMNIDNGEISIINADTVDKIIRKNQ